MSDDFNCPHCKHEINTTDWIECWNGDSDYWDEECPNCEKQFEVTVSIEVIYRETEI